MSPINCSLSFFFISLHFGQLLETCFPRNLPRKILALWRERANISVGADLWFSSCASHIISSASLVLRAKTCNRSTPNIFMIGLSHHPLTYTMPPITTGLNASSFPSSRPLWDYSIDIINWTCLAILRSTTVRIYPTLAWSLSKIHFSNLAVTPMVFW